MGLLRDIIGGIIALALALLVLTLWFDAVKYDWRRNEPLLVTAWVVCPPCGVVRGAYLFVR